MDKVRVAWECSTMCSCDIIVTGGTTMKNIFIEKRIEKC